MALTFLDVQEVNGPGANKDIISFFNEVGHDHLDNDEVPWCAAFVGAVLERCEINSTRSLLARSYLHWGTPIVTPQLGAIAVFSRGKDENAGHVGFVVGESRNELFILGGNQADRVKLATYSKNKLLGLRWPARMKDQSGLSGKKVTSQSAGRNTQIKELNEQLFQDALAVILQLEGGWSDHPDDPGGATNYGITSATYQLAIEKGLIAKQHASLKDGLFNITKDETTTIYRALFWQKSHCSKLPAGLALMHFDAAVNHGPGRAIRFLQEAVEANPDGEWGPETQSKSLDTPRHIALDRYADIRQAYYHSRPHFKVFGKGWLNRLAFIVKSAAKLDAVYHTPGRLKETRTMTETANDTTEKWWAESLTVWGTIVTALATILPLIAPLAGFDITSEMIEELGETVTRLIQIIAGLTGTSMALYGRSRATTQLRQRDLSVKI